MNRINYIFVDFENIQETDLDRIANKPVKVTLVLGELQKNLPVKLVKQIHKYSEQVQLMETVLNGKNALDFVLAYEIGVASERDPTGYFHIVSRDKGFDALIKHLKAKDVRAARHEVFSEIPVLVNVMNVEERVQRLTSHFKMTLNNRPQKRKTLETQIHVLFGRSLSSAEVELTIQRLVATKIITLTEKGGVVYKTPYSLGAKKQPRAKCAAELDASLPAIMDRAFKGKS